MGRFSKYLTNGLVIAWLALELFCGWPLFLFMFVVSFLRDRAEARWPDKKWPQVVHFWVKVLAPGVYLGLVIILLVVVFLWVFDQRRRHGIE